MHFGDFNPLEVLANAAVQRGVDNSSGVTSDSANNDTASPQSSSSKDGDGGTEQATTSNNETVTSSTRESTASDLQPLTVQTNPAVSTSKNPGGMPYVVKMVTSGKPKEGANPVMLKDATKIVIPNKDGSSKTLTVLKINKGTNPTQSVQYVLDRKEDDEGYCSRSSLDSPGQCARSDSELCDREPDVRSPKSKPSKTATTSPVLSSSPKAIPRNVKSPMSVSSPIVLGEQANKPAKIVIVSRDPVNNKLKIEHGKDKIAGAGNSKQLASPTSPVLRTLLGGNVYGLPNDSNVIFNTDKGVVPVISCDRSPVSGNESTQGNVSTEQIKNTTDTFVNPSNVSLVSQTMNEKNIPTKIDETKIENKDKSCDNEITDKTGSDKITDQTVNSDPPFIDSNAVLVTENSITPTANSNSVTNVQQTSDKIADSVKPSSASAESGNAIATKTIESESLDQVEIDDADSENAKKIARERSESFQNAFRTFITSGKPVEIIKSNTLTALKSDRGSTVISTSLLSTLKSQGHITVIGENSAILNNTAAATINQVLNRRNALALKEEEEIIDVTSVDDTSLPVKDSLVHSNTPTGNIVMALPAQQAAVLQVANKQPIHATHSKASSIGKTIPVLINTSNGKRLANVPVASLLSTNTSPTQKPVTYLVMPPHGKGTSLLLPQQVAKSHVVGVPKYQYIIQDEVSPIRGVTSHSASKPVTRKASDTWALLATVNQQNPSMAGKSKTVPLLIKTPVINPVIGATATTALLQNSVVLSSRGPQSLIPKFVTSVAGTSQMSSAFQHNLVLTSTKQTVPVISHENSSNQLKSGDTLLRQDSIYTSQNSLDKLGENSNSNSLLVDCGNGSNLGDKIVLNNLGSLSGGRNTPVSGRVTPLHSLETSPTENMINIKITGSRVTREESRPRKASTSIGKFGALSSSWSDFTKQDRAFTGTRSQMSSPIVFGSATASPTSSMEPWSPMSLHMKSDSELDTTSDSIAPFIGSSSTRHSQGKRKARLSSASGVDLKAIKSGLANVGRLHPLIDHDYGSFKEFNAEIQSSIIATTESKQKIEKYNQKAKAQRSKESLFKLDKNFKQYKKRKYTHRSPLENIRKMRQDKLTERPNLGLKKSPDSLNFLNLEQKSPKAVSVKSLRVSRRQSQSALERRTPVKMRSMPRRDGKNYVKITGSYQDDFVYYATKHSRGKSRKFDEAGREALPLPKPVKKPAVGGINVFDWYRDLSQTDKSMRFGVPESPSTLNRGYDVSVNNHLKVPAPKGGHTPVHESEVADLVMAMLPNEDFTSERAIDTPPLDESKDGVPSIDSETIVTNEVNNESIEVAITQVVPETQQQVEIDQVLSRLLDSMGESALDMISEKLKIDMPSAEHEDVVPCTQEHEDVVPCTQEPTDQLHIKVENQSFEDKNLIATSDVVKCEIDTETAQIDVKPPVEIKIEGAPTHLESADDVPDSCTGSQTTDAPGFGESTDLSALLGPYNQEPNLSQTSTSFDLDDINDDLLQSDISNMNALIGDLARTSGATIQSNPESKFTVSNLGMDSLCKSNVPQLDFSFESSLTKPETSYGQNTAPQTEIHRFEHSDIFSDVSRVVATPSPVQRPPDMIVVSMFWNDLPGLMIEGKRCVRLVDIHKQMLPAKDTGILKKRCQMMGLEIMNCNEMERDFLIRYANAAKSKSCVVVAKEDAEALVNFYVNPRPRTSNPRQSSSGSRDSSTERASDSRHAHPSGTSTPSTENELDYEPPRYTGGKGKGKGKAKPNAAARSCVRAATPTGGGKAKRKQSPLAAPPPPPAHIPVTHEGAVTHNTPLSTNTTPGAQISPSDANIKRSNRTRNKKINYAALNAGFLSYPNEEGIEVTLDDIPAAAAFDEDTRSAHENTDMPIAENCPKAMKTVKSNRGKMTGRNTAKALDPEKYSFVEELEIRRLRIKQKRKGLNNGERRKLKLLKTRLTLKVKKFKKKLDTLKKANGSQVLTNKNFLVKKALSDVSDSGCEISPVKSILLPGLMQRSVEERAIEKFNNTVPLTQAVGDILPEQAVIVKTKQDTKDVELVVSLVETNSVANDSAIVAKDHVITVKAETTRLKTKYSVKNDVASQSTRRTSERERRPSERSPQSFRTVSERRPSDASPQRTRTTSERRLSEISPQRRVSERERRPSERSPQRTRKPSQPASTPKSSSKRNVHLPVLHRSSQRGRTQTGTLNLHLYRTRESACVQCETCSDFLSVRKFLKHLHHQNSVDELCMVTLPQKLELALLAPIPEQLKSWQLFEVKRDQMDRCFQENKVSRAAKNSQKKVQQNIIESQLKTPVKVDTLAAHNALTRRSTVVLTPLSIDAKVSPQQSPSPHGETTPGGTRHSSRVRKRKQLHPIESYVYSYTSPPQEQDTKRLRFSDDKMDSVYNHHTDGQTTSAVIQESKRAAKRGPTWDTPLIKLNSIESKSAMEHVVASTVQEIER